MSGAAIASLHSDASLLDDDGLFGTRRGGSARRLDDLGGELGDGHVGVAVLFAGLAMWLVARIIGSPGLEVVALGLAALPAIA